MFFYVTEDTAALLPEKMEISKYTVHIFKPVALMKCRCCGNTGHRQNDDTCPALAPKDMMKHHPILGWSASVF